MIKKLKCMDASASGIMWRRNICMVITVTIVALTLFGCPVRANTVFSNRRSDSALRSNPMTVSSALFSQEKESFPVYVTCKDETKTVELTEGTVRDALIQAGFTPDDDDFCQPPIETELDGTVYIDFAAVEYVQEIVTESIAHTETVLYTDNKPEGYSEVTETGADGVREITYTEKLVNGVTTEKVVEKTVTLSEPVDSVTVIGTAAVNTKETTTTSADVKHISTLTPAKEILLDENGNPVSYQSKMTVRATAYTYTGHNCSTGVAPQPGYIAVNPKVIPYGTKLYIKSPSGKVVYGYAVAADTGGFVSSHPTGIDLFMKSESACKSFGVRNMEVYILE